MTDGGKKFSVKSLKNHNNLFLHSETSLVFKTMKEVKERLVHGRYDDDSDSILCDQKAIDLCKKSGFKPEQYLLDAVLKEKEDSDSASEDEEENDEEENEENEENDDDEEENDEEDHDDEVVKTKHVDIETKSDNKQVDKSENKQVDKSTIKPVVIPVTKTEQNLTSPVTKHSVSSDNLSGELSSIVSKVNSCLHDFSVQNGELSTSLLRTTTDLEQKSKELQQLRLEFESLTIEYNKLKTKFDTMKSLFS